MAAKKQPRAKFTQALKRARTEHRQVAKEVMAAQAKLEKRTRKLRTLEAKIAELERRASQPQAAQSALAPEEDKNLRPALLIYNPKSGSNGKDAYSLDMLVGALRAHGIRAEVAVKSSGKAARKAAKTAADQKQALVIAAGGDGTIEDVAAQLVGAKTVLGILPVGTMNNLARSLGIPLDLDHACALLGAGITRQIDVGCVITEEKPEREYFLETAGLGLTALVFPASEAAKRGQLGILPRALAKLFAYKPCPVQIELDDGETIDANSQLVTVSNAPLMGLNFLIAPEARMDDGLLDIAVYDGMSKTDLLDYFLAISNGKRTNNPRVRLYRARKIQMRSMQSAPILSDMNTISARKVLNIEIIPQGLSVVVGNGIGLNLPVEAVQSVPPLSGPQPPSPNGHTAVAQATLDPDPGEPDSSKP
ncbi:MAG: diacylglycerol kinase family protein [Anaerolineae bacterium]